MWGVTPDNNFTWGDPTSYIYIYLQQYVFVQKFLCIKITTYLWYHPQIWQ